MNEAAVTKKRLGLCRGMTPMLWLAALLLSMWLRILVPPFLSPASADDGLMVNLANAILRGEWLGEWNFLTLAKAPGYAIFSAASALFVLPVTVAVHFLYLVGVVLAALLVRRTFSYQLSTVTLLVLAFNPVMFGTEASRIYRDGLITALLLITTSLGGLLGFRLLDPFRKKLNGWLALAIGLFLGFLFITKIDTLLYAVPAVVLVFMGAFVASSRAYGVSRLQLHKAIKIAISILIGLAIPPLLVIGINANYYKIPVIEDTLSGPVPALIASLSSIDVGRNPQYVAVSKLQREKAYDVSPSTSELKPFLDPNPQEESRLIDPCIDAGICQAYVAPPTWQVGIWRVLSCSSLEICDEASTWFLWNLRDALMLASNDGSEEFYALAASAVAEIDSACSSGILVCTSAFIPTLGNNDSIRLPPFDVVIMPIVLESLRFSGAEQDRPDLGLEANSPQDWELWDKLLSWYSPSIGPLSPPSETTRTLITVLQKTYSMAALVLLFPSILSIVLILSGVSRRRWLGLISSGFAAGWLLQILMLAFLEVNQGNYISEVGQYLLNTSSLFILFLITATWLLVTTFNSKFAVDAKRGLHMGKEDVHF